MGGAQDLGDHLEWAPRFDGTLMLHVLRNAPSLGGVWPSMVAALQGNNSLEAKFIADQTLWFTGEYQNQDEVQKKKMIYKASLKDKKVNKLE